MTAITRSASNTPSSISLASSLASDTLCRGTLRTSIGSGTARSSGSWSRRPAWRAGMSVWRTVLRHDRAGPAGQRLLDSGEVGDDRSAPAGGEPARRLDLRSHAAGAELARPSELPQPGKGHRAERA